MLAGLLLVNTESRHLTLFLPLVAAFTARAWQHDASWLLGPFVLTALLISKVWVVINPFPGVDSTDDMFQFPAQGYFLSHGPWINDSMYLLQGAIGLLLLLWFWTLQRAHTPLGASGAGEDAP